MIRGPAHTDEQAIFHEGSKGYLCCKRRVLEFDECLKMEGCTEGKHLFVGAKKDKVRISPPVIPPGRRQLPQHQLTKRLETVQGSGLTSRTLKRLSLAG